MKRIHNHSTFREIPYIIEGVGTIKVCKCKCGARKFLTDNGYTKWKEGVE
jgi:hypothetical protein